MSKYDDTGERHLFHVLPSIEPGPHGEVYAVLFMRPREIPIFAAMVCGRGDSVMPSQMRNYSVFCRISPTGPLRYTGQSDGLTGAVDIAAESFAREKTEEIIRGYPEPPIYL